MIEDDEQLFPDVPGGLTLVIEGPDQQTAFTTSAMLFVQEDWFVDGSNDTSADTTHNGDPDDTELSKQRFMTIGFRGQVAATSMADMGFSPEFGIESASSAPELDLTHQQPGEEEGNQQLIPIEFSVVLDGKATKKVAAAIDHPPEDGRRFRRFDDATIHIDSVTCDTALPTSNGGDSEGAYDGHATRLRIKPADLPGVVDLRIKGSFPLGSGYSLRYRGNALIDQPQADALYTALVGEDSDD